MGFRDESEALRARVDTLERELGRAQREADRATELERELAETKAQLERLEAEELEDDEALRQELARTRARLEEAEARARARSVSELEREAEEATRELDRIREAEKRKRASSFWGIVACSVCGVVVLALLALNSGEGDSFDAAREWEASSSRDELDLPLPPLPSVPSPPIEPRPVEPREPVDPPERVEDEGVVLRRWGTATTQGWRHANGRCEIVVRADETLVVTCRSEELYRGVTPCSPDRSSCATPDSDELRVDFAAGRALVRTDEGPIEIELDAVSP